MSDNSRAGVQAPSAPMVGSPTPDSFSSIPGRRRGGRSPDRGYSYSSAPRAPSAPFTQSPAPGSSGVQTVASAMAGAPGYIQPTAQLPTFTADQSKAFWESAGYDISQPPAATGTNDWRTTLGMPELTPEQQVQGLYRSIGNTNPDAEGLAYWQQRLANGEDITQAFNDSAQYVLNR